MKPLLLAFFALSVFVLVDCVAAPGFVPNQLIVKFRDGTGEAAIAAVNRRHGATAVRKSRSGQFLVVRTPAGKSVQALAEAYGKDPSVEYAEPNYLAHAHGVPNDPYYGYQWNLTRIGMETAWNTTTGEGAVVAVLDTGVAYEDYEEPGVPIGRSGKYTSVLFAQAPDLSGTSFMAGIDIVNGDDHPDDDEGHGTHVTGTIAQTTNNGMGTAGVAYGCTIMPVKVLDASGSGTYADIADGIDYATQHGAQVINMSLGGSSGSITLETALANAYNAGVTIVCSSGNDGLGVVSYPAAYDAYCIAVGATRYDDTVAYYSNYGTSLDIVAPGGDLNVDQNGDGYGDGILQQTHDGTNYTSFGYYFYTGTSMAAPHVSGVAALLIAAGVASTPDEVRAALQTTATDLTAEPGEAVGWDPLSGWGLVNAAAALNYSGTLNTRPVAVIAEASYAALEGVPVAFDGSGSYDLDGDELAYSWSFGDGGTGTGVAPTHTYGAGGTYTVTLTVNDGLASSIPATAQVVITEVNDAPVAADDTFQLLKRVNKVSAPGVLANDTDPDGDPLTAILVTGTTEGTVTLAPDGSFLYKASVAGRPDSFTYKVSDGLAESEPVTVYINP